MPNWLWFVLGVVTGLLWLGGLLILFWWLAIVRERRQSRRYTQVDRIVRPIGTMTTYTRRN